MTDYSINLGNSDRNNEKSEKIETNSIPTTKSILKILKR